ncbi:MAG: KTSC domain-containing protein [Rhizomicrobium sp.]
MKQDQEGRIVREAVESSVIHAMGYDADLAVLEIEFVSGQVYRYHFIPRRIWTELRNAPSKGGYFASVIREKFPVTRLP